MLLNINLSQYFLKLVLNWTFHKLSPFIDNYNDKASTENQAVC